MRKAIFLLLGAACLFAAGFYLLRLDGEHIYTGHDQVFKFSAGLGLFLLLMAFAFALIAYGILSFRVAPPMAVMLGIASIGIAWILWRILVDRVSVHAWTMTLLFLPAILMFNGLFACLVGAARAMKAGMKARSN